MITKKLLNELLFWDTYVTHDVIGSTLVPVLIFSTFCRSRVANVSERAHIAKWLCSVASYGSFLKSVKFGTSKRRLKFRINVKKFVLNSKSFLRNWQITLETTFITHRVHNILKQSSVKHSREANDTIVKCQSHLLTDSCTSRQK